MNEKKYALISVSDKNGIAELSRNLVDNGYELISSDGSAKYLVENGLKVNRIEEITGSPELFSGRVKSLHPLIHGAILFDRNDPSQQEEADKAGIAKIDLVVVNLYKPEQFDIGGPALIRAAAKNHASVAILTNPDQYQDFMTALRRGITAEDRRSWAKTALEVTVRYDLAILKEMGEPLRYGENPHQDGVLVGSSGVAAANLLQGKRPSFNNYLDVDAASLIAADFEKCAVAIVKHGMPCGVAIHSDPREAFRKALASDPVSAFGGVIAVNDEINEDLASEIVKNFYEAIVAPSFSQGALKVLSSKPNLRVLELPARSNPSISIREIDGGFLMQSPDLLNHEEMFDLVTGSALTDSEYLDLRFAWIAVARCRSNAIVIAKNSATVGIGAGEVNRLDAARDAINRAGEEAVGALAASDGFFPFPDGLEILAKSGIKAIVAPSGSIRDAEVIEAAKRLGLTLYFAQRRHFSHN